MAPVVKLEELGQLAVTEALVNAGYSVRDISGLLGMSSGRVSQITTAAKAKGEKSA